MQSRRLLITAFIVLATAVMAHSSPARADGNDGVETILSQNGDGDTLIELVGGKGDSLVELPWIPAWVRECLSREWSLYQKEQYLSQYTGADFTVEGLKSEGLDPEEKWAAVICPTAPLEHTWDGIGGLYVTWRIEDGYPQVFSDWLVARAAATLQLHAPVSSASPLGTDDVPFITQLPTWLWVDEDQWQPVSVSTAVVFGAQATATATPINVTYTGADGETIDCGPNLGVPYNYDLKEDQQSSPCTLTYKHSSNIADWSLTTTITWEITYRCVPGCGSGTLGPTAISNEVPVTVAELQALLVKVPGT